MMQSETMWTGKTVLVTGGFSFIGSGLADLRFARDAKVGLKRNIDWYYKDRDRAHVEAIFKRMLTER